MLMKRTKKAATESVAPAPQAPAVEVKKVKKDESEFSIETSKLDVDEKELGIIAPIIPAKIEMPEKKAETINEQKLVSKQNKESDGSFSIETTSMEANDEPSAPKSLAAAFIKPTAVVQKKIEKKKE